ncbi:phenylacetic acid degradation protein PaaY [Shewanella sp. YLB-07]|uniref:phenylacetic acid degradation protein PaaY n=1 Tax=Shewanella sp. YLB-07 TaxID=2601268 RepID=UPI00128DA6A3|nr:phenylacetic acid degradation protein PaaY [Shewanella sp. YLB-07]MPY22357.1 phenylacetic acid degradation protein PaaY [Shewanella sp. YLB-07]
MPIYAIEDLIPVIDASSYVHPTAVIIGDVIIQKNCYVGPNAVLRGDFGRIVLKQGCNVQDTCVIHSFPGTDCIIDQNGHIGHGAILHGCHIGQNVLVGMNAVVMDHAIIGESSFVAATTFVKSGFQCPPKSLLIGNPVQIKRTLSEDEIKWKASGTAEYQELTLRCLQSMTETPPLTEVQPQRPRFTSSSHHTKTMNTYTKTTR